MKDAFVYMKLFSERISSLGVLYSEYNSLLVVKSKVDISNIVYLTWVMIVGRSRLTVSGDACIGESWILIAVVGEGLPDDPIVIVNGCACCVRAISNCAYGVSSAVRCRQMVWSRCWGKQKVGIQIGRWKPKVFKISLFRIVGVQCRVSAG